MPDEATILNLIKVLGPVCFVCFAAIAAFMYHTKRKYDAKQGELKEHLPEGKTERDYYTKQANDSFKVNLMWNQFRKFTSLIGGDSKDDEEEDD